MASAQSCKTFFSNKVLLKTFQIKGWRDWVLPTVFFGRIRNFHFLCFWPARCTFFKQPNWVSDHAYRWMAHSRFCGKACTVQPLPKVKYLTNFFYRNQFFEWTHFHMWEEKGLKFDLAFKETEFFRLCAQQRSEKNHIERDRKKWRHKSFWREKHRFPAIMDVDIPIVHGAAPRRLRREWQVANFLRYEQLNSPSNRVGMP